MFEKLAPQKVRNIEGGYIVQIADRHSVEYVEPTRRALVAMDIGTVFSIYRSSLTKWIVKKGPNEMKTEEREMVLARIVLGFHHMGVECEIY